MQSITKNDILKQRFFNSGLIESYPDIVSLLRASLGIQAQYLNHGLFNIAVRLHLSEKETAEQTVRPSILGWGQRQTYHFYDFDSWQDMGLFLADQPLWTRRYFQAEKIDLNRESQELRHCLTQPQMRTALTEHYGERWAKLFLWSALFLHHSRQGQLYQKWLPEDRLIIWNEKTKPASPHLSRDILEDYFSFYGPATLADAAHFFGIPQASLDQQVLSRLTAYQHEGRTYYASHWQENIDLPEVLVLGKFDPLLVAYKHKDILIAAKDQALVWKKAGQISALILIKGQLRATWTLSVNGSAISYKISCKKKISKKHQAMLTDIFRKYAKWMKKTVKKIDFVLEE